MAACKISQAIGSPFYATEEQIGITRNKRLFKRLCREYGIMTPREYCRSLPMTPQEKAMIKYPVIVKPSDSGGRKGISICKDQAQLDAAVALAAAVPSLAELGEIGEISCRSLIFCGGHESVQEMAGDLKLSLGCPQVEGAVLTLAEDSVDKVMELKQILKGAAGNCAASQRGTEGGIGKRLAGRASGGAVRRKEEHGQIRLWIY